MNMDMNMSNPPAMEEKNMEMNMGGTSPMGETMMGMDMPMTGHNDMQMYFYQSNKVLFIFKR